MKKAAACLLAASLIPGLIRTGSVVYADEYGYHDEYGNYIPYEYDDWSDDSWDDGGYDEYQEDYPEDDYRDEEDAEETEFIPDEYYDPILTNELDGWPQGPMVQAAGVCLMDMDTGTILYWKNADTIYYPASITKIMTAMLAIKYGDMSDTITCSEEVYNLEEEASHLGYHPGEKVTMIDALYGFVLHSANDLGIAIAEHIAGSISAFADLMNEEARALGCEHTHFANPHGLHEEDHYTCALDMALIATEAYSLPLFRQIDGTEEYQIDPTPETDEIRYLYNHHQMIHEESDYYRSYCTGGKTGFTDEAWNTLVTYGEKDGMRLVCVLMHENGPGRAYDETALLMEYGFENFTHEDTTQGIKAPTFSELTGLNYLGETSALFKSAEMEKSTLTMDEPGLVTIPKDRTAADLSASPAAGDGTIVYTYRGWTVGQAKMIPSQLPHNVTYSFEQERDMEQLLKNSEITRRRQQIEQTAQHTKEIVVGFVSGKVNFVTDYIQNNRWKVLLAGGFTLLVLIILLIILILRSSREYRIMRRRRLEERRKARDEEEIEKMSEQEIEEELREAMKNYTEQDDSN